MDENNLLVADVKELGRRILYAIEEPAATALPPDEGCYQLFCMWMRRMLNSSAILELICTRMS